MQVARHGHGFVRRSTLRERLEYRLVLALCFCSYFFVVLFRRVIGSLSGQATKETRSVLAETSAGARIAAGYAFSG